MSGVNIAGHSAKETALIILIGSVVFVFGVVGVGIAIAIYHDPTSIKFSGTIDMGQFVGIVIGVASAAVIFVSQQLTHKQTTQTQSQADQVWLDEKDKKP